MVCKTLLLAPAVLAVCLAADEAGLLIDSVLSSAFLPARDIPQMMKGLSQRTGFDPLLDLDPVGLVQYYGYPGERHLVTTEDGYILCIHRIPGPRGSTGQDHRQGHRPVAILAHPLVSSSSEWLVAGPNHALAFILADEGYDVWMYNARGNTYSMNHTTLSPEDDQFWDFSYHEQAVFDMPATIEYVLGATGQQQVQYVGHSIGTTIMFIMASERPDVAQRVSLFTALGPLTALTHTTSPGLLAVLAASPALMRTASALHVHQFLPHTALLKLAGEVFCSDGNIITQPLCREAIFAVDGRNVAQFNTTLLPYILSRTPAGTSFKTVDHFSQSVRLGFQQYDYGSAGNMKRYGSTQPPKYNVSAVNIPTRIYYGLNDRIADIRDVRSICTQLPQLLSCEAVADPLWTHLNFVWAKDVVSLVYSKVVDDMKEFRGDK